MARSRNWVRLLALLLCALVVLPACAPAQSAEQDLCDDLLGNRRVTNRQVYDDALRVANSDDLPADERNIARRIAEDLQRQASGQSPNPEDAEVADLIGTREDVFIESYCFEEADEPLP